MFPLLVCWLCPSGYRYCDAPETGLSLVSLLHSRIMWSPLQKHFQYNWRNHLGFIMLITMCFQFSILMDVIWRPESSCGKVLAKYAFAFALQRKTDMASRCKHDQCRRYSRMCQCQLFNVKSLRNNSAFSMAIDAMSRTLCVKAAAINGTRENNQISSANDGDTINHLQLILYAKQWAQY